ncbi:MAG: PEP-CTERM sorting domain-containing protein [Ferribacterium limneticum]
MKKNLIKLAAVASLLSFGASAQADLVIDLFNTPQSLISDNTLGDGGIWATEAGSAGDTSIIGGYRDLYVEKLSNFGSPTNNDTGLVAKAAVNNFGYLTFSTDTNTTGRGIVRWDGVGTNTSGLNFGMGDKDLSSFANFELLTIFSDQGFTFVLEAYTDATHWSRIALTSNAHNAPDPGTPSYINIGAFLLCGANVPGVGSVTCASGTDAVNLEHVNALQAIIDPLGGTVSVDLTLNQITAVPEPGSLALAGLGLFSAFAASRRRKST